MAAAAGRLEQEFDWPSGIVARAAHMAALLHDAGKLSQGWQGWVQRYQKAIGQPATEGFYAHTLYDPSDPLHRAKQSKMGRRRPHAVEGAVAVAPLLLAALGECPDVVRAAFSAIARHHGAFSSQFQRYQLVPGAQEAVAQTLACLPWQTAIWQNGGDLITAAGPDQQIDEFLVDPDDDGPLLAYLLIARALRRADQVGTARGSAEDRDVS